MGNLHLWEMKGVERCLSSSYRESHSPEENMEIRVEESGRLRMGHRKFRGSTIFCDFNNKA